MKVAWAFEQSDHASLLINMRINENIVIGPRLTRINLLILDDLNNLNMAKARINEMLDQAHNNWDPHMRLEFFKVAIRSVLRPKHGSSDGRAFAS